MTNSRLARGSLALWTLLVVLFLWIPLLLIMVYAFNPSNVQSWPLSGLSTKWFSQAWDNSDIRSALVLSLKAAALSTLITDYLFLLPQHSFAVADPGDVVRRMVSPASGNQSLYMFWSGSTRPDQPTTYNSNWPAAALVSVVVNSSGCRATAKRDFSVLAGVRSSRLLSSKFMSSSLLPALPERPGGAPEELRDQ